MIKIKQFSLYYLKTEAEIKLENKYNALLNKEYSYMSKRIKFYIEKAIKKASKMEKSHQRPSFIRWLNEKRYSKNERYIALSNCDLTRMLNMVDGKNNQLVQVIASKKMDRKIDKNIIDNGFYIGDEKYTYLFSSAGMTRDCKLLFIRKTDLEVIHNKLYCGLSKANINLSKGININKYLAYLSLCKTSSNVWNKFNIDKAIVVNDYDTTVTGWFDCINITTGNITRQWNEIPYTVTDGLGIVQPFDKRKKVWNNFQFRLPWFKGLVSEFDFRGYINQYNLNPIVVDVWGNSHDIIAEDIQYIFTKSQFKMWNYYSSFNEYKDFFKQYGCNASICQSDEEVKTHAMLNYQLLQDMNVSDDELNKLLAKDLRAIKSAHTSLEGALKMMKYSYGAIREAYALYPEMLTSNLGKKTLQAVIDHKKRDLSLGGIDIKGSYLYVIPDITAWLQYMFGGSSNGILKQDNCYTKVFKESNVILERSPHLDRSHCLSNNIHTDKNCQKWFRTNGVYTSIYDSYYQALCFDNDGDHLLVIADQLYYKIAERTQKGIVPMYYEMQKAPKQLITKDNIYNSLKDSWSINIGSCSNKLTKLINSRTDRNMSYEDYKTVQQYTAYNNFLIDFAKSGYKPPFEKILPRIDNNIMPNFFKFKSDYKGAVTDSNCYSVMDCIVDKVYSIEYTKYNLQSIGKFRFENLLRVTRVPSGKTEIKLILISRYKELSHDNISSDDITDRALFYEKQRARLLEGLDITIQQALCVLVRFLYNNKDGLTYSERFLFNLFGTELLENLHKNLDSTKICPICRERFKSVKNVQKYCSEECKKKAKKH